MSVRNTVYWAGAIFGTNSPPSEHRPSDSNTTLTAECVKEMFISQIEMFISQIEMDIFPFT
jgi:hypothetical protein